jgi:hypothetical protein
VLSDRGDVDDVAAAKVCSRFTPTSIALWRQRPGLA